MGRSKEYWMENTREDKELGINVELMGKDEANTTNMNTISVTSVNEFAKKIEDKSGKVLIPKLLKLAYAYSLLV